MSERDAEHGLLATTRYVPRLRLERSEMLAQHCWMAPGLRSLAKGRRAIANWDEDSVTMAVEAGRQLQKALPDTAPAELTLASTTLPFSERLNAGIVAAALDLAPEAVLRDVASSARAALTELAAALRRSTDRGAQLLLAAERRIARPASSQEMIFGDGAAGALVGAGPARCPMQACPKPDTSSTCRSPARSILNGACAVEMDNKTALTAAWRDHARASRFEGGRCSTVQFPRTQVCVNPDCRAQNMQEPISLADVPARVLSHTSDFLAYTPNPPFQFGHIDFEGGGRVLMEFADTDPDELRVGLPLRMVYRVKDFDRKRGFRRYFWKATPVRGAADANKTPR